MSVVDGINRLIEERRLLDVFVLVRYFYRIGEPVIEDAEYDRLEGSLRHSGLESASEYLSRSYDDDPIPEALLDEIGVAPAAFLSRSSLGALVDSLDDDKSLSMMSVISADSAYPYFMRLREEKLDFVASLKTDGVNTKMLYVDGELCLSLSRGRNDGVGFDYMEGSSKVMPQRVPNFSGVKYLKIIGESYVERDSLQYFRDKYDAGKYKTCKSSAISMLRTKHSLADYRYLHTLVFYAEGISGTLTGMFERLHQEGFETVPYILHSWQEIPVDRDLFEKWLLESVMFSVWKEGEGIPSDGCAIEVNDLTWAGEVDGQYSTRQLALKFGPWQYKIYKGIITNIRLEQKRVYQSVRIEIQPVITDDDCKAQVINSFNPSILIENDLYKGKEVYFEKNSGAVNILIHGERLKNLTGSGVFDDG